MELKYSILNNNFKVKYLKDNIYIISFPDYNKHFKVNSYTLSFIRKWQGSNLSRTIPQNTISNDLIESSLFYYLTTHPNNVIHNEKNTKYIRLKVNLFTSSFNKIFVKPLAYLYNKLFVLFLLSLSFFLIYSYILHPVSIFDLSKINFNNYIPYFFISIFIHEYGHLSAMYKYTQQSGTIGFGVYFFSPVLFSDTSMVWSLKQNQQLIVNFGGIYFEFIFFVISSVSLSLLNNSMIFYFFPIFVLRSLHNLNPFIRSDGYWILSDLINSTNLKVESYREIIKIIKKGKIDSLWLFVYGLLRFIVIFSLILYIIIFKFNSLLIFPKDFLLLINHKISFQDFIKHYFLTIILYLIIFSWILKIVIKKILKK